MTSVAPAVRGRSWTRQGWRLLVTVLRSPPGILIAAFAALRLIAELHAPVAYPDTGSYSALDFLGHQYRPWTVPLLWKVLHGNHLREVAQIALGIVAWSMLALVVNRLVGCRWVRWIGITTILILGLVLQVTTWDTTLLSESVSASLLVLLVAVLLLLYFDRRSRVLWACIFLGVLWIFTRQINLVAFLCLLPFLLVFTLRSAPRRRAAWLSAVLLVLAGWSAVALTRGTVHSNTVWKYNAVEILENRIAPDPSSVHFFTAHGMPNPPVLLSERGRFPGSPSPLFQNPPFMAWVSNHFKSTYLSYLLHHLAYSLRKPLTDTFTLASSPLTYGSARAVLPSPLSETLWGTTGGDIPFWLAVAAGLLLVTYLRGLRVRCISVCALLLLTSVIVAIITWNSATDELPRLFLTVGLSLRLCLALTIIFSAEALVSVDHDSVLALPR